MARAIGSPLSDYHGLVSRPDAGLDAAEVLRAADLTAYPLHRPDRSLRRVRPARPETDQDRHVIDLRGHDAEAYLEAVRAASPKKIKNWRRLDSKLEREMGTIELVAADRSREAFDQLIAWKREQLERTGVHDFLRPDWTRGLLLDLFQKQTGAFQGLMINLYAGGSWWRAISACGWTASTTRGSPRPIRPTASGRRARSSSCAPSRPCRAWACTTTTWVPATTTTSAPTPEPVQIGDGTATAATMAGHMAHSLDG
jgi:hypothetical protein